MSLENRGKRVEDGAWEWKVLNGQGEEVLARHFAPDRSSHFYEPRGHDEPIPLYRGQFCMPKDDPDELAYDGEVWLTWLPTPKVMAAGGRRPGKDSFTGSRDWPSGPSTSRWVAIATVRVPSVDAPPSPPAGVHGTVPNELAIQQHEAIYPAEVGDGSALTRLSATALNLRIFVRLG